MYDIIIVGGGTAGLSAAIYAVRAGKTALVLESASYGGQIVTSPEVENYPAIKYTSGFEFANTLYEQAVELGAEFKYEKVTGVEDKGDEKAVITDEKAYSCKAVILATGAKNRPLGLENEEKLIGAGVSYCAACDGVFFKGKTVAVAGGGNTAMEDAIVLSAYCPKVYVVNRGGKFKGEIRVLETLESKTNVECIFNADITALQEGEGVLESIAIENSKEHWHRTLTVSGLFIAIGQVPENGVFKNVVELDEKGYIQAGEDCKTNTEGIFVAGDCRTKEIRQLTTAASDGAVAALAACGLIDAMSI